MLPVSPEAYRAAGWTRQTRMESLLLMELFSPLHLQFEQSVSFTPAYCSDRLLGSRVCRIFDCNFRANHCCFQGGDPGGSREKFARHGWTFLGG